MNRLAVLKNVAKAAGKFVVSHRKEFLMALGVASTTGAIATAIVKSPEAKEAFESVKPEEGDTKVDILVKEAKAVVPIVWPIVALASVGMGSFMLAMHISGKEVSRAVTDGLAYKQAYNELAQIHNDYINANRKIAGEEIHEKVQEEVGAKAASRIGTDMVVCNSGKGDELFYDTLSGQFFRSTSTYISNAAMDFANDMHNGQLSNPEAMNGFGQASEWLENYLLINAGMICGDQGWYDNDRDGFNTKYCPFRIYITEHFITAPDGNPARVIEYDNIPMEP